MKKDEFIFGIIILVIGIISYVCTQSISSYTFCIYFGGFYIGKSLSE